MSPALAGRLLTTDWTRRQVHFFISAFVSIVVWGFAVPVRFRSSSPHMYKVALSCWSLSFNIQCFIEHFLSFNMEKFL